VIQKRKSTSPSAIQVKNWQVTISIEEKLDILLLLLLLLLLLSAIGLSPSGSGYFTCTQNMKLVTKLLVLVTSMPT